MFQKMAYHTLPGKTRGRCRVRDLECSALNGMSFSYPSLKAMWKKSQDCGSRGRQTISTCESQGCLMTSQCFPDTTRQETQKPMDTAQRPIDTRARRKSQHGKREAGTKSHPQPRSYLQSVVWGKEKQVLLGARTLGLPTTLQRRPPAQEQLAAQARPVGCCEVLLLLLFVYLLLPFFLDFFLFRPSFLSSFSLGMCVTFYLRVKRNMNLSVQGNGRRNSGSRWGGRI